MRIKLILPEKKLGKIVKKEVGVETKNFDLINLLDNCVDHTKVNNILNKYESSYQKISIEDTFDIVRDLFNVNKELGVTP